MYSIYVGTLPIESQKRISLSSIVMSCSYVSWSVSLNGCPLTSFVSSSVKVFLSFGFVINILSTSFPFSLTYVLIFLSNTTSNGLIRLLNISMYLSTLYSKSSSQKWSSSSSTKSLVSKTQLKMTISSSSRFGNNVLPKSYILVFVPLCSFLYRLNCFSKYFVNEITFPLLSNIFSPFSSTA